MEETNNKLWCVYIHTNKTNEKVYIGVAKGNPKKRWGKDGNGYMQTQPVFARAIQKYTWDGFEHAVIADNLTQEEAFEMEIELIAQYKSNCCRYKNPEYGYNMTDGGDGNRGYKPSEETKQKIREAQLKRFSNPEEREKQKQWAQERFSVPENNPMFGKHHSDETKRKLSDGIKQALSNPDIRRKMRENHADYNGENNPQFGTGEAIVQLTVNNSFVAEYISGFDAYQKTGISCSGIYKCCNGQQITSGGFKWLLKEDYKINNIPHFEIRKDKKPLPVVQIDIDGNLVAEYSSILEAANITKIDRGNINLCCLGRRKTAGGFRWMYKEDYDKLIQQNDLNEIRDISEIDNEI